MVEEKHINFNENVWGKLEAKIKNPSDQIALQQVSLFLSSLHSIFNYELLGKIPKDVKDILDWIRQRNPDENDSLDELELNLYKEADPKTYWETSQRVLDGLEPPYKEFEPIDLRNINLREYKSRLLEKLRKSIPRDCLSVPIGKGWIKKGMKLLSKKHPLFRQGIIMIYHLLKPLYSECGLYKSELAKDIAMLMRTDLGLEDLTEEDIYSMIQQAFKKPQSSRKVYDQLKELILSGGLKEGQKLTELELAQTFNWSGTIVDKAIWRLEKDKLITRDDKGDCFVA